MKAVITVIGKDRAGIIAHISAACLEHGVNILDITQKVFDGTFAMVMMVDVSALNVEFAVFIDRMDEVGQTIGMTVRTVHEDVYNSMHRI